jgi:hypothetical protein
LEIKLLWFRCLASLDELKFRSGNCSKAVCNLSFCSNGELAPTSPTSCCPEVRLCPRLECSQVRCGSAPCTAHTRFPPPAHLGCCPAHCACQQKAVSACLEGFNTNVLTFNETIYPWDGEANCYFSILKESSHEK